MMLMSVYSGRGIGQQTTSAEWEVRELASGTSSFQNYIVDIGKIDIRSVPRLNFRQKLLPGKLAKWSPDGRQLAFLSVCQAAEDVNEYGFPVMLPTLLCLDVADADALHSLRLSSYPRHFKDTLSVLNFAWSPSGEEIAYIEESDRNCTILSVVRPNGSGQKEIYRLKCVVIGNALSWSPDGQKLALTGCSGDKPAALVIDRFTGDFHNIPNARDPIWSPDGRMLLFRKTANPNNKVVALSVANADGTQERKVLDGEQAEFGLAWLPSGRSIAFGSTRDQGRVSEIFAIDVDGSNLRRLAGDPRRNLSFALPTFSPDGRKLIVVADSPLYKLEGVISQSCHEGWLDRRDSHDVLLIDLATGDEQRLAKGCYANVVWSRK